MPGRADRRPEGKVANFFFDGCFKGHCPPKAVADQGNALRVHPFHLLHKPDDRLRLCNEAIFCIQAVLPQTFSATVVIETYDDV